MEYIYEAREIIKMVISTLEKQAYIGSFNFKDEELEQRIASVLSDIRYRHE